MKYLNQNNQEVIIETSWDDGYKYDIEISKLLIENNLDGIFYIPTRIRGRNGKDGLTNEQIIDLSKKFKIGAHTVNHFLLTRIDLDLVRYEAYEGKRYLEELIQREVDSFCYPRGYYNDNIINIIKHLRYSEARTTEIILNNNLPKDLFKKYTTIHIYPHQNEYNEKSWFEIAKENLDNTILNGGYFHIWGHSWEIEKFNYWNEVNQFLRYMGNEIKNKLNVDN